MLDREALEAMLAQGCSLEEIGRRVDRHPSTVSYWLRKHGLEAIGSEAHMARGGLDREVLEALIGEGRSVREIAAAVDRSPTTVRHWLRFYDLRTSRAARLRTGGKTPLDGERVVQADCSVHGTARHVLGEGRYRCSRCNSEAASRFRRNAKRTLVEEAGGACILCGYARSMAALQFHHVDPSTKRFSLSTKGVARALDAARAEAQKCVLLCANCHAEVEVGAANIPAEYLGRG